MPKLFRPKKSEIITTQNLPADYDYSQIYKSPQGARLDRERYESRLATLSFEYQRLEIPTRFGMTHALAVGPLGASALVVIPGATDTSLDVEYLLAYFAHTGNRRVYALDIPGHSPVSAPTRLSPLKADYPIWLLDTLYGLGVKRADFVTIGYGSGILIKFAGFVPSRINSASLIMPASLANVRKNSEQLSLVFSAAATFRHPILIRQVIKYHLAPITQLPPEKLAQGIAEYRFNRKYRKAFSAITSHKDPELAKLTAPTLVIAGQDNQILETSALVARARRVLPHLTLELIPNAGYAVGTEQPAHVAQTIANFLSYVETYHGVNPALVLG